MCDREGVRDTKRGNGGAEIHTRHLALEPRAHPRSVMASLLSKLATDWPLGNNTNNLFDKLFPKHQGHKNVSKGEIICHPDIPAPRVPPADVLIG